MIILDKVILITSQDFYSLEESSMSYNNRIFRQESSKQFSSNPYKFPKNGRKQFHTEMEYNVRRFQKTQSQKQFDQFAQLRMQENSLLFLKHQSTKTKIGEQKLISKNEFKGEQNHHSFLSRGLDSEQEKDWVTIKTVKAGGKCLTNKTKSWERLGFQQLAFKSNEEEFEKSGVRNIKTERDYKEQAQQIHLNKQKSYRQIREKQDSSGLVDMIIKMQKELGRIKENKKRENSHQRNSKQLNRLFKNDDAHQEICGRVLTPLGTNGIIQKVQIWLSELKKQLQEQIEEKQSLKKQQSNILLELQNQLITNQKLGSQFRSRQKEQSQLKSRLKVLNLENRILREQNEIIRKQLSKKEADLLWRNDKISLMKYEINELKSSVCKQVRLLQSKIEEEKQMREKHLRLIKELEGKIMQGDGQICQLRTKLQIGEETMKLQKECFHKAKLDQQIIQKQQIGKIQKQMSWMNQEYEKKISMVILEKQILQNQRDNLQEQLFRASAEKGGLTQKTLTRGLEKVHGEQITSELVYEEHSQSSQKDEYELMMLKEQIHLYEQKLEECLHREIDLSLDCGRKDKEVQQLKGEVERYRALTQNIKKLERKFLMIQQELEDLHCYILFYEQQLKKAENREAQLTNFPKSERDRNYEGIALYTRELEVQLQKSKQQNKFISNQLLNSQSTISKLRCLLENLSQQLVRLTLRSMNSKHIRSPQIQGQK